MKRRELEEAVRQLDWPQFDPALRARVLAAASLVEAHVSWSDRLWFSRTWRFVAAGLVVGCLHLRNLRNRHLVVAVGATAAALALLVVFIPYLRETVPAAFDSVSFGGRAVSR